MLLAINGVLAQGALARFGLTWRPSPDIAALTLPKALPAAALLCGALAAVPGTVGYLGLNLVLVLSIAFFLAGLAVVHALARRLEARLFMLIAFYAVLFFGWPVLVVAGLGFLEPWVGLRRRFAATAPGQGEM
jgi:hypothetical protein